MMRSVSSCEACTIWNTPLGKPAASKHSANRSAHSGVCAECLRITALPAINAGITLFTAIRYG